MNQQLLFTLQMMVTFTNSGTVLHMMEMMLSESICNGRCQACSEQHYLLLQFTCFLLPVIVKFTCFLLPVIVKFTCFLLPVIVKFTCFLLPVIVRFTCFLLPVIVKFTCFLLPVIVKFTCFLQPIIVKFTCFLLPVIVKSLYHYRALMFVHNNFGGEIGAMDLTDVDRELLVMVNRELAAYLNNLEHIK